MKGRWILLSVIFALSLTILWRASKEFDAQARPLDFPIIQKDSPDFEILGHSGGNATAVFVSGSYTYVAFGKELQILETSDPTQPVELGATLLPQDIDEILVKDQVAYLGAGSLYTVDVSNPASPIVTDSPVDFSGTPANPDMVLDLAVENNYLYVAAGGEGLWIYDISTPTAPKVVNILNPTPLPNGTLIGYTAVAINGPFLFTVESHRNIRQSRITVFDLAQPANPSFESSIYIGNGGYDPDLVIQGKYLYFSWDPSLWIIDISNPADLTIISYTFWGMKSHISLSGHTIYGTLDGSNSLAIMDVSNPSMPSLVTGYPLFDSHGIDIQTGYAYVTQQDEGTLQILNIANPLVPTQAASYQTVQKPTDLSFQGSAAYIIRGYWQRIEKWDLSNPGAPRLLGGLTSPGGNQPLQVIAINNIAYLGTGNGITAVDFSDPKTPVVRDTYSTPDAVPHISISGKYLYAWEGVMRRILIFDISTPAKLSLLGTYNLDFVGGHYTDFLASGSTLFLLNDKILLALDVSNPAAVKQIGSLDFSIYEGVRTWISPTSLAIQNDKLFVGSYIASGGGMISYYGDFWVFDISKPAQIVLVKEYFLYKLPICCALDVAVEGTKAYVAGNFGMWAFDISNPANPQAVGPYQSGSSGFQKVAVNNGRVFLLAGKDELSMEMFILEYTGLSVAGSVLQSNGLPFPGPTISVGVSTTVATGSHAGYFVNRLPPGAYPVVPSLSGFRFVPPSRVAAIPPSQADYNFTILPEPVNITTTGSVSSTLRYTDTQGLPTGIVIPSGAVTTTLTLTLTPTMIDPVHGFAFTGHAFDLEAASNGASLPDLTFSVPVTVTVNYSNFDVRLVSGEDQQKLWLKQGGGWVDAAETCQPSSVYRRDPENNSLSVPICRTGTYALMGPTNEYILPIAIR